MIHEDRIYSIVYDTLREEQTHELPDISIT